MNIIGPFDTFIFIFFQDNQTLEKGTNNNLNLWLVMKRKNRQVINIMCHAFGILPQKLFLVQNLPQLLFARFFKFFFISSMFARLFRNDNVLNEPGLSILVF